MTTRRRSEEILAKGKETAREFSVKHERNVISGGFGESSSTFHS